MQDRIFYLVVPIVLLVSLGLDIGLTFAPCYAALCDEEFYPYETRIHIAYFFAVVTSIALILALRNAVPLVRKISEFHLWNKPLPIIHKRISVGGIVLSIWIYGLVHATSGYWEPTQFQFYSVRGDAVNVVDNLGKLAYVGVTGHWCDILAGLLILPVTRSSILGKLFGLHLSSILFAHKLMAYGLLVSVTVHTIIYYLWVGYYTTLDDHQKEAFSVDNPTISGEEAERRGYWSQSVLASGMLGWLIMIAITITSLRMLRRSNYNLFYYFHIIGGSLFFFLICVHANTNFYFLLPGLVLWILDWAMRLRWLKRNTVESSLDNAGNGWYRIRIPAIPSGGEKGREQPLQHYHLNFPSVSSLQCHAFTASSVGSIDQVPTFLFRRSEGKKEEKLLKEWTWKLSELSGKIKVRRLPFLTSLTIKAPPRRTVHDERGYHVSCFACFVYRRRNWYYWRTEYCRILAQAQIQ